MNRRDLIKSVGSVATLAAVPKSVTIAFMPFDSVTACAEARKLLVKWPNGNITAHIQENSGIGSPSHRVTWRSSKDPNYFSVWYGDDWNDCVRAMRYCIPWAERHDCVPRVAEAA